MTSVDPYDPADIRPLDPRHYDTAELPATPQRDRTIAAASWRQAPAPLRALGDDIGRPVVAYKRRIGDWLLWRAGPPAHGDARYMAVASTDASITYTFRLWPDGRGEGAGPDGLTHTRFRAWKEALRDAPAP